MSDRVVVLSFEAIAEERADRWAVKFPMGFVYGETLDETMESLVGSLDAFGRSFLRG